jgi:uncharacterized protein involved in exopolysaccharide biosynthesis
MVDENGNRDARLDRIERIMETMAADHEQFRADHKQLLIAQVLQKDAIGQLLTVTQEHTRQIAALDSRVDKLVFSIADLIQRIPPESLR